jgi:hypothetical protein
MAVQLVVSLAQLERGSNVTGVYYAMVPMYIERSLVFDGGQSNLEPLCDDVNLWRCTSVSRGALNVCLGGASSYTPVHTRTCLEASVLFLAFSSDSITMMEIIMTWLVWGRRLLLTSCLDPTL